MPKNKNLSKITSYLTADTDNGILSSNVSQTITGSLTVTGNLTAQQFIVSSSVTYLTESFASGSHKFGDSSDDIHTFTGSLVVSGSANPLRIGTNLLFVSSSGLVGINNVSPTVALDVTGAGKFSSSVTADFLVVGTTAASSGGLRLGTQVAIRARNVANTANIPLIESTAADGVSVSNGALILASTGAATFSGNVTIDKSSPLLQLNAPTGTAGEYRISNGVGTTHWSMYSITGGSNTQGNWALYSLGKTGGAGAVIEVTPAGKL